MSLLSRLRGMFSKPVAPEAPAASEQIRVGDLVWIARGHICAINAAGGVPFKVMAIRPPAAPNGWWCGKCGEAIPAQLAADGLDMVRPVPVSWLKKIEPLAEPETIESREEITA